MNAPMRCDECCAQPGGNIRRKIPIFLPNYLLVFAIICIFVGRKAKGDLLLYLSLGFLVPPLPFFHLIRRCYEQRPSTSFLTPASTLPSRWSDADRCHPRCDGALCRASPVRLCGERAPAARPERAQRRGATGAAQCGERGHGQPPELGAVGAWLAGVHGREPGRPLCHCAG